MTAESTASQAIEEQTHSTMMAWRVHEFGPPEVMRFERLPRPEPDHGEALVKVKAAGVGPWDGWIRAERAPCRSRSRSLWARTFPVKSSVLAAASRSTCGRSGLRCHQSAVYRRLRRVRRGVSRDGLRQADLADPRRSRLRSRHCRHRMPGAV